MVDTWEPFLATIAANLYIHTQPFFTVSMPNTDAIQPKIKTTSNDHCMLGQMQPLGLILMEIGVIIKMDYTKADVE